MRPVGAGNARNRSNRSGKPDNTTSYRSASAAKAFNRLATQRQPDVPSLKGLPSHLGGRDLAADTLDRLLTTLAVRIHAFALCEIKTGWRLAFASMDAIIIHYVLRGHGSIRVEGGFCADYAPFSLIVVPARVAQSLGASDAIILEAEAGENCGLLSDKMVKFTAGDGSRDTLVVCATISASYGGALGLFDRLREPVINELVKSDPLRTVFGLMLDEVATPGIGTQALVEAQMKQCLILVLRRHLEQLSTRSPFFLALEDHRLSRAVIGVVGQPAASHTVDSLATLAGMSRSTFAERFAETFKQTPIEFVQRVRLRLGAELLQTTDLPIKIISATVGYASRSHFSRAFREMHGIDPRSFRERSAKSNEFVMLSKHPSVLDRIEGALDGFLESEA